MEDFREFRLLHQGETILVCGCGVSLADFKPPPGMVTIGVNDVGRLFNPDYLVVVNKRKQFSGDRFRYVEESKAKTIFSHVDLGIDHAHQVRFKLGSRTYPDLSDPDSLPYTTNSPYMAVALAARMGASRIGLIGVDFTDHHFFGATGSHLLSKKLPEIDGEYAALHSYLNSVGIEFVNLSEQSRLTGIPKVSLETFLASEPLPQKPRPKIFFVGYRFLSCGSVFDDGLARAAQALGLTFESAYCDDPCLGEKVRAFNPDLLFVVHGRKFSARWRSLAERYRSAVWLLDEPYEVDNTASFSKYFDAVYVNDSNTIKRHRNAHYLPVCFDPVAHTPEPIVGRSRSVGFIGGANPWREEALVRLRQSGLLSYVVGGPWKEPSLTQICLSQNIPASETASLYKDTAIVLNLFRTQHHFNKANVPAFSMNPRVYEALACGALVISEHRPEVEEVFPALPVFKDLQEMEALVAKYLGDPALLSETRNSCLRHLAGHSYEDRLKKVIAISLSRRDPLPSVPVRRVRLPVTRPETRPMPNLEKSLDHAQGWAYDPQCARIAKDGSINLGALATPQGKQRGLIGTDVHSNIDLQFDLQMLVGTEFVVKIHQLDPQLQKSPAYEFVCKGTVGYLAVGSKILGRTSIPLNRSVHVCFAWRDGQIEVALDGKPKIQVQDSSLPEGYSFFGAMRGIAKVKNISINRGSVTQAPVEVRPLDYRVIRRRVGSPPTVSIVTTVFDRVEHLERCIKSVQNLRTEDWEQVIVADCPLPRVRIRIEEVIQRHDPDRKWITFATMDRRWKDWGIAPASAGIALATGTYLAFLSDDNGYLPDHFDPLLEAMKSDQDLGFVYSSCQYAGRLILNSSSPEHGNIDLGQPLFLRRLFEPYGGARLPFDEVSWDWRIIEALMQKGVKWKHVDQPSFIFRLAKYPQLVA